MSSRSQHRRSAQSTYGAAAVIALAATAILLYWWSGWTFYPIWLLTVNLITFLFFRFDKRQAQLPNATRVPEIVLLSLLSAGGVLGGGAAMYMRPRHKTRKLSFVITLIAGAILHLGLAYSLFLA